MSRNLFLAAALCAGMRLVAAQSVYRCGNEYSQAPCAHGKIVNVDDSRTGSQLTDARSLAASEKSQAAQIAREHRLEAAASRAVRTVHVKAHPAVSPLPTKAVKRRHAKAHKQETTDFWPLFPGLARPRSRRQSTEVPRPQSQPLNSRAAPADRPLWWVLLTP